MEILLRKQPYSISATFYDRMRFLIEDDSVQIYATLNSFDQASVFIHFFFFCLNFCYLLRIVLDGCHLLCFSQFLENVLKKYCMYTSVISYQISFDWEFESVIKHDYFKPRLSDLEILTRLSNYIFF